MSRAHAVAAANNPLPASRSSLQTLREALQLLWGVADLYAKRRLLLALALVACTALLAALTPIALKLAIDALTTAGQAQTPLVPLTFVGLYVAGQYVVRSFGELRVLMYGQAEQRVRDRKSVV